jgi:phosphonate transport system substrate-binding protein
MKLRAVVLITLLSLLANPATADEIYTFGIGPQTSASRTAKDWTPIIKYLEEHTGKKFRFATARSSQQFSLRVAEAKYDFAYLDPTDYIKYQGQDRYNAIARARNLKLKAIVVVRKDSSIEKLDELVNKELAVPDKAFAADTLARAALHENGIAVKITPLAAYDAVYRAVAQGRYSAGGGVLRTFNSTASEYREQLRVLWTSEGYTPQAFAAHARVPKEVVQAVQEALIDMDQDPIAKKYLKVIAPEGLDYARDVDWDDARKLDI